MNFNEILNQYMEQLGITAKELSDASGLAASTLSRYRLGDRVPEKDSRVFRQLCSALASIAEQKYRQGIIPKIITKSQVMNHFLECRDMMDLDREQFRQKLNTLIFVLTINISDLCRYINYDTSTLFRIRNGSRKPSDPVKFAASVAEYISQGLQPFDKEVMAELFGCTKERVSTPQGCFETVRDWLISGQGNQSKELTGFLKKLDEFNLNEYIKAIHFDELKVPSVPFQLPTSKTYFGLDEMMESELDFLKAAVLSRSTAPVIMYSDMPMEEMAKEPDFPKKWMFGMALMLKKGLHLNIIHRVDRPFSEMMLGLESWIPMYMTGQVSPYYLKDIQNQIFLHFLKVSGTVALSGEAISGHHSDGKYYLTKNRDEVSYYRKRAEALLHHAFPLMDIYRKDSAKDLKAFLLADSHVRGKRRNILSSLPLYTMEESYLEQLLKRHPISATDKKSILDFARLQKRMMEKILEASVVEDEIPFISEEEFRQYPMSLALSGMFYESDILYTYEDYLKHLEQTRLYARLHPNYIFNQTSSCAFRNLQILIHERKWVMVSKGKSPAIHFVIHHPKLRKAIECFVPPITEVNL